MRTDRCWMALLLAGILFLLPRDAAYAQPGFSADRFRAHVTFLADDLLEGREAGTRGHEIAARYVASQLALLGVKPGAAGGFLRPGEFAEVTLSGRPASLRIRGAGGRRTLVHGKTMLLRAPFAGPSIEVSAPLVFAGYGVVDAALGIDDYAGLDARGKMVVVIWGAPPGVDSEVGAHLQSEQARVAAAHGAVAMIRVQTGPGAAALPWTQLLQSNTGTQTAWVARDGVPSDPDFGLKGVAVVEPRAAAALFAGAARSLDRVLRDGDALGRRPAGFPLAVTGELRASTTLRRFSSPAVVGVIDGADPILRDEYVVVMAHADHIGVSKKGSGDRINNGALDNAAGVATLLEVARALMSAGSTPRRSIVLVANTAEEKGLLGAEQFAHDPTVPIDRIVAAIDIDMPMLLYEFTDVVAFGASHSSLQTAVADAARAMGAALSPDPMPEQAVFVRSDHYAMVKAGVPAVLMATGMANGGRAAWTRFLDQTYHQPGDDLMQPIVWPAGARFAEFNYRLVRALADGSDRARWYANDYFGNLFAPTAPKVDRPAR